MKSNCPNCGNEISNEMTRCPKCGELFSETLTLSANDLYQSFDGQVVHSISSEDEIANDLLPPAPIQPVRTRKVQIDGGDGELRYGSVKMKGDLVLTEVETGAQFFIPQETLDEVTVGRYDRAKQFTPSVNLDMVNAVNFGVSRLHATISREQNILCIRDHNSKNGTYINGQRIVPNNRRVVRDGDIIGFGKLNLKVSYNT